MAKTDMARLWKNKTNKMNITRRQSRREESGGGEGGSK